MGDDLEKRLKLMQDELNRARTAATARISSFHTRGAILVTASGLFTSLQVGKPVNFLSFIATGLFLGAAVIGILVLKPIKGHDVNPADLRSALMTMRLDKAHEAVMDAHEFVLDDDKKTGDKLSVLIRLGYIVLVVAWVTSYASSLIH